MAVEEPDRSIQSTPPTRRTAAFQDSFVLYNNNCASIRFGFGNKSPYINIAKVIESQKGRRPVAGQQMYDNDHSIYFSLNLHELIGIEKNFDKLVSGKMQAMQFIHDSKGDSNKKVMLIGCGLDDEHENEFGIAVSICPTERTGQIIFDDPIDYALFFPQEKEISDGVVISDLEIIKRWITIAIDSKLDTSSIRSYTSNYNNNGNRFNNGGGNRFGNFRRRNEDNDDENRSPKDERPVIRGKFNNDGGNKRVKEDAESLFDADENEIMG